MYKKRRVWRLKKDLIKVRNEIGKVVDYRYYTETFSFFDAYIQSFFLDKEDYKERIKNTELICAAIAYEPYLLKKIKNIAPDIVSKIKEFIIKLI